MVSYKSVVGATPFLVKAEHRIFHMAVTIRPSDFSADRGAIIQLMLDNLTPLSSECRFEWLYRQNPHGEALGWVAVNDQDGTVVGTAAVFPRMLFVRGELIRGWVLGDFCLNVKYRSLGPAVVLQRACLKFFEEQPGEPFYDFPSQTMVAVYKRLGWSVTKTMQRVMKPIRLNQKIRSFISYSWLAEPVAMIGNTALKFLDKKPLLPKGRTIEVEDGPWGEEFTELSGALRNRFEIYLHRSAAYLNWRFFDNPFQKFTMVVARDHGRLIGYGLLGQSPTDALVVDLFCNLDRTVFKALLWHMGDIARRSGKASLRTSFLLGSEMSELYKDNGFWFRDDLPLLVGNFGEDSYLHSDWYLTEGDRDS